MELRGTNRTAIQSIEVATVRSVAGPIATNETPLAEAPRCLGEAAGAAGGTIPEWFEETIE